MDNVEKFLKKEEQKMKTATRKGDKFAIPLLLGLVVLIVVGYLFFLK